MSSRDFDTTTPAVWMKNQQLHLKTNLTTDEWFILNIQETGTDLNIYTLCLCACVNASCMHMCTRMCVCVCVCVRARARVCACMQCAFAMHHFQMNFVKMDMNAMMSKTNQSSNFYFPDNKT